MEARDAAYLVSDWECERNKRIKAIQGNGNPFVERVCR
ncbi:MAG: endonuclease [Desulfovibrionaceae bacterium]|nr:endonuclease [Desulfovibrionaceae bacterium]